MEYYILKLVVSNYDGSHSYMSMTELSKDEFFHVKSFLDSDSYPETEFVDGVSVEEVIDSSLAFVVPENEYFMLDDYGLFDTPELAQEFAKFCS